MPADKPTTQDPAAVFLALATFRGDAAQASAALKMDPRDVMRLSEQYGWQAKLRQFGFSGSTAPSGKAANKADAFARALNRSMNFLQAVRLREMVDRVLLEVLGSEEKLAEWTTVSTKNGFKREARPIVDLVNAADTAQLMTARALQDTPDNAEADKEAFDGQELSLAIGKALDAANMTNKSSSQIVREQLADVEKAVAAAKETGS